MDFVFALGMRHPEFNVLATKQVHLAGSFFPIVSSSTCIAQHKWPDLQEDGPRIE